MTCCLERFQILLAFSYGRAGFSTLNSAVGSVGRRCHRRTRNRMGRKLTQGQILLLQLQAISDLPIITLFIFIRLMSIVKLDIGDLFQVWVSFDYLPYGIPFVIILLNKLLLKIVASGSLHRRFLLKWRLFTLEIYLLFWIERLLIQIISMGYSSTNFALAELTFVNASFMWKCFSALVKSISVV